MIDLLRCKCRFIGNVTQCELLNCVWGLIVSCIELTSTAILRSSANIEMNNSKPSFSTISLMNFRNKVGSKIHWVSCEYTWLFTVELNKLAANLKISFSAYQSNSYDWLYRNWFIINLTMIPISKVEQFQEIGNSWTISVYYQSFFLN